MQVSITLEFHQLSVSGNGYSVTLIIHWNPSESNFRFMHILITPWRGDYELHGNCSQVAPIEIKIKIVAS